MIDNKYNVGDKIIFLETVNIDEVTNGEIIRILIKENNELQYRIKHRENLSGDYKEEEILGLQKENLSHCNTFEKHHLEEIKRIIKTNKENENSKIAKIKQEYFNFLRAILKKLLTDNDFINEEGE